jgi:arsenite-transporting ATPase
LRIIVYTGKGGTGKTVLSCSTAVNLAYNNHKTLILSSDPAHTLSDAFMMGYIGSEPSKVIENLYALQVDPVIEINKHFNSILSYLASTFFSKGIDETLSYELAMLPGMTQLFSLLKIEEVMHHGDYEAIVLDIPASGEALRYLYFPKLAGSIGRKITGYTGVFSGFAKMFQPFSGFSSSSSPLPPSNVLEKELTLMGRLDSLSKLITDSDITSLRLVANPDTFSIENAKRALMSANLYGINVDLVIINKIMPKGSSDKYFANWAEFQTGKVEEARSNFYPLPVKEARLYEKELRGIDMLGENAKSLFGKDDPSMIFYSGKVFEFLKEAGDSTLRIKMKVPFTEKDDFDISRYGEQIAIKVKGPTGYITNVIPLPVATIGMDLSRAKLDRGVLNLFFEKRP